MLSFFGLHSKALVIINTILSITGLMLVEFFNLAIEHAAEHILITIILLADFFSGMIRALKLKNFSTRRALDIVWQIAGYNIVIFMTYQIEQVYPSLSFLDEAVILPIVVFNFLSFLKNLTLIGVLKNEIVLKIFGNIDKYKETFDFGKKKTNTKKVESDENSTTEN